MLKLLVNNLEVPVKYLTFNGGEEQVTIDTKYFPKGSVGYVEIVAHLKSSSDVMKLLILKDAVTRLEISQNSQHKQNAFYTLNMPYVSYARQDRVMQEGEALSIKVFSNLINMMKFDQVLISDPHSDVTSALIDNVIIKSQLSCFMQVLEEHHIRLPAFPSDRVVVAPDAGARKKASTIAKYLNANLVEAGKSRDVTTGEITGTVVYGDVKGKSCLIVDDICEGGMTFIKLGEKLKEAGASKVILYVTHGIFSKGKEVLDGAVDEVYSLYDWTENF